MSMTKTERLSHYAIMIVAVSALVVSVWQVRISQEHNKLSVKPYLDFFSSWDDGAWRVVMSNEGVGPAVITRVDYTYKGVTYNQLDEMLKAANLMDKRMNSTNFGKNSPFAVEKTVVFLQLNRQDSSLKKPLGISVSVKYQSIYEEPFELNMSF